MRHPPPRHDGLDTTTEKKKKDDHKKKDDDADHHATTLLGRQQDTVTTTGVDDDDDRRHHHHHHRTFASLFDRAGEDGQLSREEEEEEHEARLGVPHPPASFSCSLGSPVRDAARLQAIPTSIIVVPVVVDDQEYESVHPWWLTTTYGRRLQTVLFVVVVLLMMTILVTSLSAAYLSVTMAVGGNTSVGYDNTDSPTTIVTTSVPVPTVTPITRTTTTTTSPSKYPSVSSSTQITINVTNNIPSGRPSVKLSNTPFVKLSNIPSNVPSHSPSATVSTTPSTMTRVTTELPTAGPHVVAPPTTTTVTTTAWTQVGADIDGVADGERLGYAVALTKDGDRLFVGGALEILRVYEYDVHTTSWSLRYDLTPLTVNLVYDLALSTDGTVVVVGQPFYDKARGAVDVLCFHDDDAAADYQDKDAWSKRGKTIVGEHENDRFGRSVGLDGAGRTVAAGAWKGDNGGYVTVFGFNTNNNNNNNNNSNNNNNNNTNKWTPRHRMSEGGTGSRFGWSLAVSADGSVLVVGAPFAFVEAGPDGGSVFFYNPSSLSLLQRIDGAEADDHLGTDVSVTDDGSRVAVGANAGNYVKLFGRSSLSSSDQRYVELTDPVRASNTEGDFGWSVALAGDGSRLVVGDLQDDGGSDRGRTFVYAVSIGINNNGTVRTRPEADFVGERSHDRSGFALALGGGRVAVGANRNAGAGGVYRGHVRVYESSKT